MEKSIFDIMKAELKTVHARSPEERKGIVRALRLNREALGFAAQGRDLEAHAQFMFVEAVLTAIRGKRYESQFKRIVDCMTDEPVTSHGRKVSPYR